MIIKPVNILQDKAEPIKEETLTPDRRLNFLLHLKQHQSCSGGSGPASVGADGLHVSSEGQRKRGVC